MAPEAGRRHAGNRGDAGPRAARRPPVLIRARELSAGLRLLLGVPGHLRNRLDPATARRILADRRRTREVDFLRQVGTLVFGAPASPYRMLLRHAGCAYGDVVALVGREGVEGALERLRAAGVSVSVDEFKGRRPLVRGGQRQALRPADFLNPAVRAEVPGGTGGSRGPATPVSVDLAHLRARAVNTLLGLEARDGLGWVKGHWQVPGGGALARLLEFAAFGDPPRAWFSQVDPAEPSLHARYRWSARALRWGGLLAGVRLPRPVHAPVEAPEPVGRWVDAVRRRGATPHLFTFVSSAVRLAQTTLAAGGDLAGVQLTVTGEPLTAARQAVIRQAGATPVSRYAVMECGAIGLGCLRPSAPDEVHLLDDLHAVTGPDPAAPGRPAPLYLTSLGARAPFVLLNVSMGDQAVWSRRRCGCPLETLGWSAHLHGIRSEEKLTAGGMTLLDVDVIRILEEALPARFGGGPTDYQLAEEESEDGRPRLRLRVHPRLGPLDTGAIGRRFLAEIGTGSGVERLTALLWTDAGMLTVTREPPQSTAGGKILHLAGPAAAARPTADQAAGRPGATRPRGS